MPRLDGGPLRCDNEQHAALNDDCPSKAEAVIFLEMRLDTSLPFANCRVVDTPLKDDDPCCRLCGDACYMQVDMRAKNYAKRHMQVK